MTYDTCYYCNHKTTRGRVSYRTSVGAWGCINAKACFERMKKNRFGEKQEFAKMRKTGNEMSNVCFNLSQALGRPLNGSDVRTFGELFRAWDAIR